MKIIEKNIDFDELKNKDILKISKLIIEFLNNKDCVSDNVLHEIIRFFYDIKLEDKDYVEYLNDKNNTFYNLVVSIPTNIVISDLHREGHGRDFSFWTQNYQVIVSALVNDFDVSKDEYTIDEIKSFIDSDVIYPLYSYGVKTSKDVFYRKNDIKYLVDYQGKNLDENDEYFHFMINKMIRDIGIKTIIKKIKIFITSLKINSFIYDDYSEIVDSLVSVYNSSFDEKIKSSCGEIIRDYLYSLPYLESYYKDINLDQIIGVLCNLDFEENRELCLEIQNIVINLKDAELCYEFASNFDWVDKKVMGEIVILDGNPDFNYFFASEVEGADIERHKQVIFNSKYTDDYILERTLKL